jgi:magnesium-transporting ATPase (P-type)
MNMNHRISFEKYIFWTITLVVLVSSSGLVYMMLPAWNEVMSEDPVWYVVAGSLIVLLLSMYTVIAIFIYKDATRKKMNVWLWVTAVIYVPNFIGLLLYFIVRRQHARRCTRCGGSMGKDFEYCPYCGQLNSSGVRI